MILSNLFVIMKRERRNGELLLILIIIMFLHLYMLMLILMHFSFLKFIIFLKVFEASK